jgi:hypothetical protein
MALEGEMVGWRTDNRIRLEATRSVGPLALAGPFADHVAEKMSELALHIVGETPEQAAAVDALEGAQLIEVTKRP